MDYYTTVLEQARLRGTAGNTDEGTGSPKPQRFGRNESSERQQKKGKGREPDSENSRHTHPSRRGQSHLQSLGRGQEGLLYHRLRASSSTRHSRKRRRRVRAADATEFRRERDNGTPRERGKGHDNEGEFTFNSIQAGAEQAGPEDGPRQVERQHQDSEGGL